MKIIKRTDGQEIKVDDDVAEFLEANGISVTPKGGSKERGYRSGIWYQGKDHYLHRFIAKAKDGHDVDHINGDIYDDRRINLRSVPHNVNMRNERGIRATNTSGYSGVTWDKARERWRAQARLGGKMRFLGRYDSPEEAAMVVIAERLKHGYPLITHAKYRCD